MSDSEQEEKCTATESFVSENGHVHESHQALKSRSENMGADVRAMDVISDYARTWSLLQAYDEQALTQPTLKQNQMQMIKLQDAVQAIEQLKQVLVAKGEASQLFGQLRGEGLASAIATIEQGFGGELFYPNVASRAAHLLYFVIKNHPLTDGNKRSGSFLFLWYLRMNQHLLAKPVVQLINENTLVTLALLVAESKPDQKTMIIRLVEHLLVEHLLVESKSH